MKHAMIACVGLALASTCSAVAAGVVPSFGSIPPLLAAAPTTESATINDPGLALIKAHAFSMLTPAQQSIIIAAGEGPTLPSGAPALPSHLANLPKLGDAEYAVVRRIISRESFDRFQPIHQRALVSIMEDIAQGREVPAFCFTPGTDPALVDAFNAAIYGRFGERFRQGARWPQTATNASTGNQGDRITLTYSFVPDGTIVPTLTSGVTQPSNLFAFMNARYSTVAEWQGIYAQVLARWAQLIGVTYVYEPNDDASAYGAAGQLGVRGDCRFGGTALDGPSSVLAFNYFPSVGIGGDMVVDTADTFFDTLTTNSLRLRNVLAHEHGHGLGMAHVCPVSQTKLMEPFVSVAFDGPLFDDIINGQRYYGDILEPNDTPATATLITNADATLRVTNQISIDDDTDVDVFRFDIASQAVLTVTPRPLGGSYLEGPQNANGSCSAGTNFDAVRIHNLRIEILASNGTTVLADVNVNPAGLPDTAIVPITTPGTYYARVTGEATDNIQAYELAYTLRPGPAVVITFPSGSPSTLSAQAPTTFPVRIQTIGESIVPGSARVFYKYSGSTFLSSPLIPLGGENYTASLPQAPCAAAAQYYVAVTGAASGQSFLPASGSAGPRSAGVGGTSNIFSDDFEIDRGWAYGVAGDTATSGVWLRADPVGTAAQPENAVSPTNCAVTGNAAANQPVGTNDIDNGFTTLLSPRVVFPSGTTAATIAYQRWFSNNAGSNPGAKVMRVEVSGNDGSSWTTLETVGPTGPGTTGGWVAQNLPVPAGAITPNFRVRFVPDDTGTGSLVEAAIDDVVVSIPACVQGCRVDTDTNGTVSIDDLFIFISLWFAGDGRADFDFSGNLTIDDIFQYINRFFVGCP